MLLLVASALSLILTVLLVFPCTRVLELPQVGGRWLVEGGRDGLLVVLVGCMRRWLWVSMLILRELLVAYQVLLVLSWAPVCVLINRGSLHPGPLHESRPGLEGLLVGRSPMLHLIEARRGGRLPADAVDCSGGRLLDRGGCGYRDDRRLCCAGSE
jgi:hypothetical protein